MLRTEIEIAQAWIPEQMEPGTLFLLEQGEGEYAGANPYRAVLACPGCGTLGLITRDQYEGRQAMICGSDRCSVEYMLVENRISFRRAQ